MAQTVTLNNGVQHESWGPFAEGRKDFFSNPVLTEIGRKYGKSSAQTALRFLLQSNVVVIPKSTHKERMAQNIDVFDFELAEGDMESIANMDSGTRYFTLTLEQQENSLSRFVPAD